MVRGGSHLATVGLIRTIGYKSSSELALRGLNASVYTPPTEFKTLASILKMTYGLLHACKIRYKRVFAEVMVV
jgi:hypothetical protein